MPTHLPARPAPTRPSSHHVNCLSAACPNSPNCSLRRHPDLIRLTGRHPFNCEPNPARLFESYITPPSLHYVGAGAATAAAAEGAAAAAAAGAAAANLVPVVGGKLLPHLPLPLLSPTAIPLWAVGAGPVAAHAKLPCTRL